jgi:lipopolysaccharide transport system ATP-binding protein
MSDTVIKVENLSKQYRLGLVGTGTLSHDLKRWWYVVRGKEDPYLKIGETNKREEKGQNGEYVWALKDINFEVKQGEVIGIIGKNGAGKSTLLKILSRITTPTTGQFKVKGRIASLLEVGTGFHPELTGAENIYLNGAILGMTKAEIRKKYDEIVAFSGVERYIDTPVKRYSSGMSVRLAFAVAAHLEPEILIIDEVLAVGDAEFQKKCLGKMKDVASEGRTVLFVSHNMSAVRSLCSSLIYLKTGSITFIGDVNEGISFYLIGNRDNSNQSCYFNQTDFRNEYFGLSSIEVISKNENNGIITMEDEFAIRINIEKLKANFQFDITCQITDPEGNVLIITSSSFSEINNTGKTGVLSYSCKIPANFFNEGEYGLNILFLADKKSVIDQANGYVTLSVLPGTTKLGQWMGKSKGFFRLTSNKWEVI